MRIAVNTRLLIKNRKDGISRFADETLKLVTRQHPEHQFIFFFDRKYDDSFIYAENIKPLVVYPQARHPILYDIWFNRRLPKILKKEKADLFVSPDGFLPLDCPVPSIAVIHDINFEHYPQFLPKKDLQYYKKRFPVFAKQATNLCTVSQFSKQDLIETYHLSSEKITVVYNGVADCFQPLNEDEQIKFRIFFAQHNPYFVFTGSLHERKNISRMFLAFDLFKKQNKLPHKILIAGEKMWWTKEMQDTFDGLEYKNDIIFLGQLADEQLSKLVGAAEAMIYVPIFEGFGIPPLEAMQCGVPVLASNVSSIPEILENAALYANPFSVEEIAQGLEKIIKKDVRNELIDSGFEQIKKYTWQRTADLFWQSILATLQELKSRNG